MKREEVTLIFRDIYLVTWHHKWLNQTEQIIAGSREAAMRQNRVIGNNGQRIMHWLGIKGINDITMITDNGIYGINGNEEKKCGITEYSLDNTYWLIICWKKRNNKNIKVVAQSYEEMTEMVNALKHQLGYNGKLIVNEINSRGVFLLNNTKKEKVPNNIGDNHSKDPEYLKIPKSYTIL